MPMIQGKYVCPFKLAKYIFQYFLLLVFVLGPFVFGGYFLAGWLQ